MQDQQNKFKRFIETIGFISSVAIDELNVVTSEYEKNLHRYKMELEFFKQETDCLKETVIQLKEELSIKEVDLVALNNQVLSLQVPTHSNTHTEYVVETAARSINNISNDLKKRHLKRNSELRQAKLKIKSTSSVGPVGSCLFCGSPTKTLKHKFCSISHQVKYGHQQNGHNVKPLTDSDQTAVEKVPDETPYLPKK